jgi:hypothetical protein
VVALAARVVVAASIHPFGFYDGRSTTERTHIDL